MFAEAHTPEELTPQQLDTYLEKGWFRMGQTILLPTLFTLKVKCIVRYGYVSYWMNI